MIYSEILDLAPLGVSMAAFGLSLWVALRTRRWDRPVIIVSGRHWQGGVGTVAPDKISFSMEVANTGNHTTEICSAFWEVECRQGRVEKIDASHGGNGVESLFQHPTSSDIPARPFTLTQNQRKDWAFEVGRESIRDQATIIRMRPAVEYIARKNRAMAYGSWQTAIFLAP